VPGITARIDPTRTAESELTEEASREIVAAAIARAARDFSPGEMLSLTPELRGRIQERLRFYLAQEAVARNLRLTVLQEDALVRQAENQMLGLGFLEELLPPARRDLTEIAVNPDGSLWVKRKGQARFEQLEANLAAGQVLDVVGKVLGPLNRRVSEAEPIVSARLPRTSDLPGGARVHVVHPVVAVGQGFPALNIRLFEAEVVTPSRMLDWGSANQEMLDFLQAAVRRHRNILVVGGTGSGKTTVLNMLSNFIPPEERVVTIEDAQELWLGIPHWVAMEARPASIEGKYEVTMGNLLDSALRMTPEWIVVGEIRSGPAAAKAMLAQITGHAGMSTIHAFSTRGAVTVLTMRLLQSGEFEKTEAAKTLISQAVHLVIHVGYSSRGERKALAISQVEPELRAGNVFLTDLYRFDEGRYTWERLGGFTRWTD